jgi:hypothetical protein
MEKIKNFFSKYGLIAFLVLFLIMMMRGCSKNASISKLKKENSALISEMDSLNKLVMTEDQFHLIVFKTKSEELGKVINEISKYDRNKSMMELQFNIIDKKESIDKKIKSIEKMK